MDIAIKKFYTFRNVNSTLTTKAEGNDKYQSLQSHIFKIAKTNQRF